MFQYTATGQSVPSPTIYPAREDIKTGEQIQYVSQGRVISRGIFGSYVHSSLRFRYSAKVLAFTWVTFEGCAPWLAVLLNHCILILSAPDGIQIETALPFCVNCFWPFSSHEGTGGLILQRAETRYSNHSQAARKSSQVTLFSLTHPLNYVRPVGDFCCYNDKDSEGCQYSYCQEHVLLVTGGVPPLLVAYSISKQEHTIWCILTRASLLKDKTHSEPANSISLATNMSTDSSAGGNNQVCKSTLRIPEINSTCQTSELMARNIKVSKGNALLGSPHAAMRAFCASYGDSDSILCLLLRKNKVANSKCEPCLHVFVVMVST